MIEVVEQQDDANYNYSLVRLDLPAADRYGTARIFDRDPSGGELLRVIAHPDDVDGFAKSVSTGSEAGLSTVGDNWFQHRADTTFVSPGAGVLDSAGRLIGVNTDGGCHPVFPFGATSALKMTALLDHSTTLQNLGSDGIWFSNGDNTFTKNSLTVRGHFIPFTGDFDRGGDDDVFWYGRGSGADFIWWSTGGAFTEQSVTVQQGERVRGRQLHAVRRQLRRPARRRHLLVRARERRRRHLVVQRDRLVLLECADGERPVPRRERRFQQRWGQRHHLVRWPNEELIWRRAVRLRRATGRAWRDAPRRASSSSTAANAAAEHG
ncbi:S1 family peptidase [Sorangium sp. So ce861]|uniref:S1 family peptidase n=1 Tax=Sorangium sp. So ce861 TaxID=3133323 RepID=UPI003F5F33D4